MILDIKTYTEKVQMIIKILLPYSPNYLIKWFCKCSILKDKLELPKLKCIVNFKGFSEDLSRKIKNYKIL